MIRQIQSICYGWIFIFFLFILTSFILTLFVQFSLIEAKMLSWLTLIIGIIIMLIGGFISGFKNGEKGWLIGFFLAVTVIGCILIIQYISFSEFIHLKQTVDYFSYFIATVIGSIFGVNSSNVDVEDAN